MSALKSGGRAAGPITRVTGISELGFHGVAHRTGAVLPPGLSPFEAYLLSLMDGVSSVDDVVAASGLSLVNAALALERLVELGLVAFSLDTAARPPEPPPPSLPANRPAPVVEVDLAGALADVRHCAAARQYALARQRLATILVSVPGNPEALVLQAQLSDPAQARARAEALVALAETAERDSRVPDAMRILQEAVAECPHLAGARFSLAVLTLRSSGASVEVLEHLRLAHELAPDNSIYSTMYQRVCGFLDRASGGKKP